MQPLSLHPRLPSADAIERVALVMPEMPYVNRPRPASGLAGKFSFQYTLACALLDGHVGKITKSQIDVAVLSSDNRIKNFGINWKTTDNF